MGWTTHWVIKYDMAGDLVFWRCGRGNQGQQRGM